MFSNRFIPCPETNCQSQGVHSFLDYGNSTIGMMDCTSLMLVNYCLSAAPLRDRVAHDYVHYTEQKFELTIL